MGPVDSVLDHFLRSSTIFFKGSTKERERERERARDKRLEEQNYILPRFLYAYPTSEPVTNFLFFPTNVELLSNRSRLNPEQLNNRLKHSLSYRDRSR